MLLTERVARGDEEIQLPDLPVTPPTMASQLDREPVQEVKDRHYSRFSMAAEPSLPEPLRTDTSQTSPVVSTSPVTSPSTRPIYPSLPSTTSPSFYDPPSNRPVHTPKQPAAALAQSTPSTSNLEVTTKRSKRKLQK